MNTTELESRQHQETLLRQATAASLSRYRAAEGKCADAHKVYKAACDEKDLQYKAYREARQRWAEAAIDLLPELPVPAPQPTPEAQL